MATLNIPITKAGNRTLEVDTDALPDAMFQMALEEGLKVMLNKGMSKITTKGLEGDELTKAHDAAYEKGLQNLEAVKAGTVKKGRAASTGEKVSGVVMTEARRLAKEVVKDAIKAARMKVSHVPASEITKAANELIANDPSYITQAKANIEARALVKPAINIAELVHESPALVKADAERRAASKAQLSAKQAGKTAPRKAQPIA